MEKNRFFFRFTQCFLSLFFVAMVQLLEVPDASEARSSRFISQSARNPLQQRRKDQDKNVIELVELQMRFYLEANSWVP